MFAKKEHWKLVTTLSEDSLGPQGAESAPPLLVVPRPCRLFPRTERAGGDICCPSSSSSAHQSLRAKNGLFRVGLVAEMKTDLPYAAGRVLEKREPRGLSEL